MGDAKPAPTPDLATAIEEVRRAHRHLLAASDRLMATLRVVVPVANPPQPVDKDGKLG